MNYSEVLKSARTHMKEQGLDAYIIPSSDPHQSEYVADHWKSRIWISGFTGSAGVAVITAENAALWTDGRYFIQAEKELKNTPFQLHKMGNSSHPHVRWLADILPQGGKIGVHGKLLSESQYITYSAILGKKKISLDTSYDLISVIHSDRPDLPTERVWSFPLKYAGKTRTDKIDDIRKEMSAKGVSYHLLTALDDIAWTFNLRGSDVEFNPVFLAYALIGEKESLLFIDESKLDDEITSLLKSEGTTVLPYDSVYTYVRELTIGKVLVDPSQANRDLYASIGIDILADRSIPKWLKAIKNETEINCIKNTMARDGAALAYTFYWLEKTLETRTVSEYELAQKLIFYRKKQGNYLGESFSAIVGYKSNGAIIHYRPDETQSAEIHNEGMLLVDSGGQYTDGTTDITRTLSLSMPSEQEKKHFTLVLRGNIALSRAIFPAGTSGGQLDVIARQFLWQEKLNFQHGTGHGVGFCLNVHEPPQGFAGIQTERGKTVMKSGMLTSNEPGYYLEGAYGIRIENLVISREEGNGYLGFETITLYPMDLKLIEESIINKNEKAWLNRYHDKVYRAVSPHIIDEEVKSWFKIKCRPLN